MKRQVTLKIKYQSDKILLTTAGARQDDISRLDSSATQETDKDAKENSSTLHNTSAIDASGI